MADEVHCDAEVSETKSSDKADAATSDADAAEQAVDAVADGPNIAQVLILTSWPDRCTACHMACTGALHSLYDIVYRHVAHLSCTARSDDLQ